MLEGGGTADDGRAVAFGGQVENRFRRQDAQLAHVDHVNVRLYAGRENTPGC
ncbi:hypothetical protein [Parvibaculum sp.]|jgi:hypothetical protein|uniref:hypothetical protein n=1 Tax=Parvibaculum sp. TaxID=2024848 RepID=UPI0025E9DB10|nr:hypothetical protein [Parvibaculum sp.]|tara:strand:- start:17243 stop:17398 length:156 start_codon:yes stop_codon:yes gene_type:complete